MNRNITLAIKEFFAVLILGLAFMCVVMFCFSASIETFDTDEYMVEDYYVDFGDSLWKIAKEHTNNDCDLRDYIDAVIELNNMSNADIIAGDVIQIYVKK